MVEAYSLNVTTAAGAAVPLNSVKIQKGCTAVVSGAATINLNKCGVYMVSVNGSTATAGTIQLYVNGVPQPSAQSTGTTPNFTTLVQVDENNTKCPCSAPTSLQVVTPDAAVTFTDFNVVVTKVV